MNVKERLGQIPMTHGIYILKGPKERVLYVGKAKNLKSRVRSYFQNSAALDARKQQMVKEIESFDYIVTGNELEALTLESNFIKRFRPRYNIILRDDKNYPYLKLTEQEQWPRLEVVRRIVNDGSLYFGPYIPAGTMWETLKFIRRTFPLRICRYSMEKPFRPCVQYQMGRCLAPCSESLRTGEDNRKYREVVDEVKAFLGGEKKELLSSLEDRMKHLSGLQHYEEAAKVRDRLRSLESAWESQRVISPELGDADVVGLYREKEEASIFLFFIRGGMVVGQRDFFLKKVADLEDKGLIEIFLQQFYAKEMLLPDKIILPVKASFPMVRRWLSEKKGKPLRLVRGKSEAEIKVLRMASDNAVYSFNLRKEKRVDETLMGVRDLLGLSTLPRRIAAVDASNISGSQSVGAVIVYEEGRFQKDDYRLFTIKTVDGADDFSSIAEIVMRYLRGVKKGETELPQLLLIDGGRGQLEAALEAVRVLELPVETAAIAKAKDNGGRVPSRVRKDVDRVYVPGRRVPVYLEPFLPTTHLLQKIRDEVHRFAITYHKKLRSKRSMASPLEQIAGIGKTRRLTLLRHFGSIEAIRKASEEDLAALKGMNRKVAKHVKETLQEQKAR